MRTKCKKKPFHDKGEAVKALHVILNNNRDMCHLPNRTYQCPLCLQWHLTSKAIDDDQHVEYKLTLDWSKLLISTQ
ncbi:hypothetical protein [Mucilaginibacter gynuensis]|uniref:hypothetical protein n=1 Tax=Mucilaginibacter gynuensis TaxID=1302236 RepID=UPI0031EFD3B3